MTWSCRPSDRRARIGWSFVVAVALCAGCEQTPESTPVVTSEYEHEPRDIVLVLDTSGSMKSNDPNRMAIYATAVFADLLEKEDRLVVLTFPTKDIKPSNGSRTRRRREPVSFSSWIETEDNRLGPIPSKELKARIRDLPYNSQFTVFTEPMDKALRVIQSSEGRGNKAIVFFSDGDTDRYNDGRPHSDNHAKECRAMERRLDPLRQVGCRFFGMTLGNARHDQFDKLAANTGGEVVTVDRPEDLAERFASVFSRILETRVEPISFTKGQIQPIHVRKYVKELIFLVPDGSPEVQFRMQEPRASRMSVWSEGRLIETSEPKATIEGQCEEAGICRIDDDTPGAGDSLNRYTVLRVPWPNEGEWKIELTDATKSAMPTLLIQNYDLYLQIDGERNREGWIGEPNRFVGRLVNSKGQVIQEPEIFEGARYLFEARDRETGELVAQQEIAPDAYYRMVYDFVPQGERPLDLTISLTNDDWLNRRVYLGFKGVKDIALVQGGPADFGEVVPWTDSFIETLGAIVNVAVPIWTPGERRQCTAVNFRGSSRHARGVVFHLDNTALQEGMKARITNPDGEELFTLDEQYQADVCIRVKRSSAGGSLSTVSVPIRSASGREISGTVDLQLGGSIARLPAAWRLWYFWIPIEGYILARLLKMLIYWWFFSWGRGDRFYSHRPRAHRAFYPGILGVHRIPLIPRLIALPIAAVVSQFNWLRVAIALMTMDYPPVKPILQECRWTKRRPKRRKGQEFLPKSRRIKLALLAFVMDGLLLSIWMGRLWRPPIEKTGQVLVVKTFWDKYFCHIGGEDKRWRRQGETLTLQLAGGKRRSIRYDLS